MAMVLDLASLPHPLFAILQGYASLAATRELPELANFSFHITHHFFLNWLLLNPHFQAYSPSRQYQALFWKWAVGKLEALLAGQDAEIDDRLYTHLVRLVQGSSSGTVGVIPPSETYVTYLWKSSDVRSPSICPGIASATLLESRTLIERGTTGLKTWTASISLAEFLIRNPELVRGQRVLELGSGAGFLGIVIATLQGPFHVHTDNRHNSFALWLTDVDPNVLERCQNNIRLPCNASSYHTNVHCAEIDWTDATDSSTRLPLEAKLSEADADVIIGADIVFDPGIIPALVDTIESAMTSRKIYSGKTDTARAYIALTVRNEDTHSQFVNEAKCRFNVQNISTELNGERVLGMQQDTNQAVRLYKIQQRE